MSAPEELSAAGLLELAAQPERAERPVTDGVSPLTVVRLDADGISVLARAPAPHLPWRVVVGVVDGAVDRRAPAPPAVLDVAICRGAATPPGWVAAADPGEAVTLVSTTIATAPRAAAVLCQLLRVNEGLSLTAGLSAESFAYSMLLAGPEFAAWNRARTIPEYRPSPAPVLTERDGDTVTLVLNRPEVRNAYDSAMRDALVDALRGLTALGDAPAVVLRGSGPSFCSGGDLSQFGTTPDPVTAHAARTARSPGLLLHRLGVTARLHGTCVGAGIELPAFCGRVVADPTATFRLPEVAMGLIPGAGGTASIPARVGRHRAAYMALTGAAVNARQALAWGLIDHIG